MCSAVDPSLMRPEGQLWGIDLAPLKLELVNLTSSCLIKELPYDAVPPRIQQSSREGDSVGSCSEDDEPNPCGEAAQTVWRLRLLVHHISAHDGEFVLKLALYLRRELHLRNSANFLAALCSREANCLTHLNAYLHRIIVLPGDWLAVANYAYFYDSDAAHAFLMPVDPDGTFKPPTGNVHRATSHTTPPPANGRSTVPVHRQKFGAPLPHVKTDSNSKAPSRHDSPSAASSAAFPAAAVQQSGKAHLPNALRRALVQRFEWFSGFSLAKYNNEASERRARRRRRLAQPLPLDEADAASTHCRTFTLKQLVRLLHISQPAYLVCCLLGKRYPSTVEAFQQMGLDGPFSASDEATNPLLQHRSFDPSMAGTRMRLPIPQSWETQLSRRGNTGQTWNDLVSAGAVPYMATLRNLRNLITRRCTAETHERVLRRLVAEDQVALSKQLPYRFYSAYLALETVLGDYHRCAAATAVQDEQRIGNRGARRRGGRGQSAEKQRKLFELPLPREQEIVELVQRFQVAVDTALCISARLNIVPMRGTSAVILCVSAAMLQPLAAPHFGDMPPPSSIQRVVDVAALLAVMMMRSCEHCLIVVHCFDEYVLFREGAGPMEGSLRSSRCQPHDGAAETDEGIDDGRGQPKQPSILRTVKALVATCVDLIECHQSRATTSFDVFRRGSGAVFPFAFLDELIERRVSLESLLVLDEGVHRSYAGMNRNAPALGDLPMYLARLRRTCNPDLVYVGVNVKASTPPSVTDCWPGQEEGCDRSTAATVLGADLQGRAEVRALYGHRNDILLTGFSDAILRFVAERSGGGALVFIERANEVYHVARLSARENHEAWAERAKAFRAIRQSRVDQREGSVGNQDTKSSPATFQDNQKKLERSCTTASGTSMVEIAGGLDDGEAPFQRKISGLRHRTPAAADNGARPPLRKASVLSELPVRLPYFDDHGSVVFGSCVTSVDWTSTKRTEQKLQQLMQLQAAASITAPPFFTTANDDTLSRQGDTHESQPSTTAAPTGLSSTRVLFAKQAALRTGWPLSDVGSTGHAEGDADTGGGSESGAAAAAARERQSEQGFLYHPQPLIAIMKAGPLRRTADATSGTSSEMTQRKRKRQAVVSSNAAPHHGEHSGALSTAVPQRLLSSYRICRFFISSTFVDMNNERNAITLDIFPRLRRWAANQGLKVSLLEVDLRWGIPAAATAQQLSTSVCLNEVSRCSPFFLGVIGARYGYCPPAQLRIVADEDVAVEDFAWMEKELSLPHVSVTEMEMRHAMYNTKRRLAEGEMPSALFFARDYDSLCGSFLDGETALRTVYEPDTDTSLQSIEKLKRTIQTRGFSLVDYRAPYARSSPATAVAEDQDTTSLANLDQKCVLRSDDLGRWMTSEEPFQGAVGGPVGKPLGPAVGRSLLSSLNSALSGTSSAQQLTSRDVLLSMSEFSEKVFKAVRELICRVCGVSLTDAPMEEADEEEKGNASTLSKVLPMSAERCEGGGIGSPLASSTTRDFFSSQVADLSHYTMQLCTLYTAPHGLMEQLVNFVITGTIASRETAAVQQEVRRPELGAGERPSPSITPPAAGSTDPKWTSLGASGGSILLLEGGDGDGKSSALAALSIMVLRPMRATVPHIFFSSQAADGTLRGLLLFLLYAITTALNLYGDVSLHESSSVEQMLQALVQLYTTVQQRYISESRDGVELTVDGNPSAAAAAGPGTAVLTILLDGLDKAAEAEEVVRHLGTIVHPIAMPSIRFVVSAAPGTLLANALRSRNPAAVVLAIPLLSEAERGQLIRLHLASYGKQLEESLTADELHGMLRKADAAHPSYLTFLITYLRLFSTFDILRDDIRTLPGSLSKLFLQFCRQLEERFESRTCRLVLTALLLRQAAGGIMEYNLYRLVSNVAVASRLVSLLSGICIRVRHGRLLISSNSFAAAIASTYLPYASDRVQAYEMMLVAELQYREVQMPNDRYSSHRALRVVTDSIERCAADPTATPTFVPERYAPRELFGILQASVHGGLLHVTTALVCYLPFLENLIRDVRMLSKVLGLLSFLTPLQHGSAPQGPIRMGQARQLQQLRNVVDFLQRQYHVLVAQPSMLCQCVWNTATTELCLSRYSTSYISTVQQRHTAGNGSGGSLHNASSCPPATALIGGPRAAAPLPAIATSDMWVRWLNRHQHGGEDRVKRILPTAHSILCMAESEGEREVALGCQDGVVRRVPYDDEGTVLASLKHNAAVAAVIYVAPYQGAKGRAGGAQPSPRVLVSGCERGLIYVWSLDDNALLQLGAGHLRGITGLACHPHELVVCSSSSDSYVMLWGIMGGGTASTSNLASMILAAQRLYREEGDDHPSRPSVLAPQLQSRSIAFAGARGGQATLSPFHVGRHHNAAVAAVSFHHSGEVLASGSWDGCVALCDLRHLRTPSSSPRMGREARSSDAGEVITARYFHLHSPIRSLLFTPSLAATCIVGCYNGSIAVIDYAAASIVAHFCSLHTSPITRLAISWDGRLLASADEHGSVQLTYAGVTGTLLGTLNGHRRSVTGLAFQSSATDGEHGSTSSTVLAGDGGAHNCIRLMTAGADSSLQVWSVGRVAEATRSEVPANHTTSVTAIATSEDGSFFVSGAADGTATVFTLSGGDDLATELPGYSQMTVSRHDVTSVQSICGNRTSLFGESTESVEAAITTASTFQPLFTLSHDGCRITCIRTALQDTRILVGIVFGIVYVWSSTPGLNRVEGRLLMRVCVPLQGLYPIVSLVVASDLYSETSEPDGETPDEPASVNPPPPRALETASSSLTHHSTTEGIGSSIKVLGGMTGGATPKAAVREMEGRVTAMCSNGDVLVFRLLSDAASLVMAAGHDRLNSVDELGASLHSVAAEEAETSCDTLRGVVASQRRLSHSVIAAHDGPLGLRPLEPKDLESDGEKSQAEMDHRSIDFRAAIVRAVQLQCRRAERELTEVYHLAFHRFRVAWLPPAASTSLRCPSSFAATSFSPSAAQQPPLLETPSSDQSGDPAREDPPSLSQTQLLCATWASPLPQLAPSSSASSSHVSPARQCSSPSDFSSSAAHGEELTAVVWFPHPSLSATASPTGPVSYSTGILVGQRHLYIIFSDAKRSVASPALPVQIDCSTAEVQRHTRDQGSNAVHRDDSPADRMTHDGVSSRVTTTPPVDSATSGPPDCVANTILSSAMPGSVQLDMQSILHGSEEDYFTGASQAVLCAWVDAALPVPVPKVAHGSPSRSTGSNAIAEGPTCSTVTFLLAVTTAHGEVLLLSIDLPAELPTALDNTPSAAPMQPKDAGAAVIGRGAIDGVLHHLLQHARLTLRYRVSVGSTSCVTTTTEMSAMRRVSVDCKCSSGTIRAVSVQLDVYNAALGHTSPKLHNTSATLHQTAATTTPPGFQHGGARAIDSPGICLVIGCTDGSTRLLQMPGAPPLAQPRPVRRGVLLATSSTFTEVGRFYGSSDLTAVSRPINANHTRRGVGSDIPLDDPLSRRQRPRPLRPAQWWLRPGRLDSVAAMQPSVRWVVGDAHGNVYQLQLEVNTPPYRGGQRTSIGDRAAAPWDVCRDKLLECMSNAPLVHTVGAPSNSFEHHVLPSSVLLHREDGKRATIAPVPAGDTMGSLFSTALRTNNDNTEVPQPSLLYQLAPVVGSTGGDAEDSIAKGLASATMTVDPTGMRRAGLALPPPATLPSFASAGGPSLFGVENGPGFVVSEVAADFSIPLGKLLSQYDRVSAGAGVIGNSIRLGMSGLEQGNTGANPAKTADVDLPSAPPLVSETVAQKTTNHDSTTLSGHCLTKDDNTDRDAGEDYFAVLYDASPPLHCCATADGRRAWWLHHQKVLKEALRVQSYNREAQRALKSYNHRVASAMDAFLS